MMKTKLIAICALAILMLMTGSAVNANQLIDFVDSADNQQPFPPGPNFYPGGATAGYLISEPDWGWTHTFSFEGPENPPPSIISATLEIRQFGVLATDQHQIKLDGVSVGFLDNRSPAYPHGFPNELSHTTTFNLGAVAIANLIDDKTANIWLDINYPNSVAIYWSRLTIQYVPAGLDHIEVSGPIQVNEESGIQYTCTAHFINSGVHSSSDISNSATWSDNSDFASIDSSGFLTTSSVSSDESFQIKTAFGGKTDTHDITIKNVILTVSIPAKTYPAGEPHFIGVFEVRRTIATNETLRVYYSRSGSTATSGADYMDLLGYVDILPGETSTPVSVIVIDDAIEEATETVKLTLIAEPSYIIDPDAFSAIVTIADDEKVTIPEISGHKPEKDSIQVPRDTIIQVHVTDSGSGVEYDGGPITIHVEGDLIYDGADETYEGIYNSTGKVQTIKGICRRVGTETDYTFVFQPSIPFDFEQKVDVVVNATDKTGYEITDTYSFYTLMQTFGKNIKVNSDVGKSAQNHPDSATDSLGNIWVVWEHAVIGNDSDIYIGKLPKDGSAFGPSQLVFGDLNNQLKPAIAIDDNHKIYVAWQGNDPSGFWDVFVSTSTNGTDWSVPVKVNSDDPHNKNNQKSPAIGIDKNGKAYIVWEDNSKGNDDKDIWVTTSTDATTWTSTLIASAASNQTEPSVSIDVSDNTAYIFWTDSRGTDTDIFMSRYINSSWNDNALVDSSSFQLSAVGSTSSGDIHLLWVDNDNGTDDIFYGKDDSNLSIDDGTSIVDESGTFQSFPSIAANGTKVFACWQDSRNVSGNADTDIYYTENSGPGFGTNILVNDDIGTYTQKSPVIGTDIYGNPFIVWVDNRERNNDIYAAGITSTGSILKSEKVKASDPMMQIVQINENSDTIDDADDVTIEVPGGALPVDTDIKIAKFYNPPDPPAGAFGIFYELSPSGFDFLQPVTINIPHEAANCPGHSTYNVYFYDPTILPPASPWRRNGITNVKHLTVAQDPTLPSDVHVVRFKTTHFTVFGIGGGASVAGGGSAAAGGGGGGGGGGCSVSAGGEGNVVEFLLPYVGFIIVLAVLTGRDARVRKARRNMAANRS
ncbi:MAG: hypothetical protein GY845_28540 [Planctomycetes bacterium]|nr:hypothetical protein [Planctomycetota bacterium]